LAAGSDPGVYLFGSRPAGLRRPACLNLFKDRTAFSDIVLKELANLLLHGALAPPRDRFERLHYGWPDIPDG
jgi:hypothetical protein